MSSANPRLCVSLEKENDGMRDNHTGDMGADQSAPAASRRARKGDVYRSDSKGKRVREEESFENEEGLEEALDLMSDNDFQNLANKRARHIKGTLSWARLADGASRTIADQFLTLRTDDDLRRAVDHARELHARLQERTGIPHARVTKDQRERINLLHAIAIALSELIRVRSGSLKPDYDTAGRASTLRQRYRQLGGSEQPFVRQLMEQVVSKVLATSTSGAVKAVYNRALSHWLPSLPVPASSGGTQVQWDSDDDF